MWWRGDTFYWLNQLACGNFRPDFSSPDFTERECFAELRDGFRSEHLEYFVGAEVAGVLSASLTKDSCLRVHLGTSLPHWLQNVQWTWCHLDGLLLNDRIEIEHYSPEPFKFDYTSTPANVRFFNLWPNQNPFLEFVNLHGNRFNIGYDHGAICAKNTLNNHGLAHESALIVAAHGTENTQRGPMQDEHGNTWSLPTQHKLPKLIVLVACGSECGNLGEYAKSLLEQSGVTTVIAPVGQVDAETMSSFLLTFLEAFFDGADVSTALTVAAIQDPQRIGPARLCLYGNGSLRLEPEASSREELVHRINLLTLSRYQCTGHFSDAVYQLHNKMNLVYDDPHESSVLFRDLDSSRELLWPVCYRWLAPFMAYQAQKHDESAINYYRKLSMGIMQKGQHEEQGLFYYHLSTAEYRAGNYEKACRNICKGIKTIEHTNADPSCQAGVKLMGILVNILVDLNVPKFAEMTSNKIAHALREADYQPDAGYETDNFVLLDREARVLVRMGEPTKANEKIRYKRAIAISDYSNAGHRELATQCFISAWACLSAQDSSVDEIRSILEKNLEITRTISESSSSNDYIYLLKSLAASAWLNESPKDLWTLSPCLSELFRTYDYLRDPSPLGAIIFYCAMAGDANAKLLWPLVEQRLCDHGYFFELAIYSALLGGSSTESYLDKFQKIRRASLAHFDILKMFPDWSYVDLLEREIRDQEVLEKKFLVDKVSSAENLSRHGLIPL